MEDIYIIKDDGFRTDVCPNAFIKLYINKTGSMWILSFCTSTRFRTHFSEKGFRKRAFYMPYND
jgi:hypothetical protein